MRSRVNDSMSPVNEVENLDFENLIFCSLVRKQNETVAISQNTLELMHMRCDRLAQTLQCCTKLQIHPEGHQESVYIREIC